MKRQADIADLGIAHAADLAMARAAGAHDALTVRFARTLTEAFGPYTSQVLESMPEPLQPVWRAALAEIGMRLAALALALTALCVIVALVGT